MTEDTLIPRSPTDEDYTREAKAQEAFAVDDDQGEVFTKNDPFALFRDWLELAKKHEANDPNALSLATVDADGLPDVRVVLLKDLDDGFTFYTNKDSAKGRELSANPRAAMAFHWKSIRRQIRVRGMVEEVADDEADAYFASRSRGAQTGAWASRQSHPLANKKTLEGRVDEVEARFDGQDVPRPPFWGGYRLKPMSIEFWVNRPYRLHDRLLFERDGPAWRKTRLYP
ncbi:pyridoxamine 5'-phosphate oxidase [Parvularcula dongshanensis]|uniref:Pyridoxine/pyridoxamine 5'-phosphate oxidase n=1 Tax=Parvularcula dongshanensis TaxID=1173995 RepID=A0A840I4F2_9PROT|nr:pyridoxamine 5'-phosphate oxidase [Parvularcula dongshanensis]MBB4659739.1 pyridoxamine 5'-phosphate oxidase [Parvularcula dongshanensis]